MRENCSAFNQALGRNYGFQFELACDGEDPIIEVQEQLSEDVAFKQLTSPRVDLSLETS